MRVRSGRGADFSIFTEPNTEILDKIEKFLTGAAPNADADRALATILFTDIVGLPSVRQFEEIVAGVAFSIATTPSRERLSSNTGVDLSS